MQYLRRLINTHTSVYPDVASEKKMKMKPTKIDHIDHKELIFTPSIFSEKRSDCFVMLSVEHGAFPVVWDNIYEHIYLCLRQQTNLIT